MHALLDELRIELPSWAFGSSGTRFKVFGTPGTPRTVWEKIADAATVPSGRSRKVRSTSSTICSLDLKWW